MVIEQEVVLHKKSFQELTVADKLDGILHIKMTWK